MLNTQNRKLKANRNRNRNQNQNVIFMQRNYYQLLIMPSSRKHRHQEMTSLILSVSDGAVAEAVAEDGRRSWQRSWQGRGHEEVVDYC